MSNVWGRHFTISIFGESHGPAIGIVIGGILPGQKIDWNLVSHEMARRAPGQSALTTPRKETDAFEILSGIKEDITTGAPLCGMIRNNNTRSHDYALHLLRPGHADYTAQARYHGFADLRGGGHFSGRLTAPLTFAGAIAKQLLHQALGIRVGAHISSIRDIQDLSGTPDDILLAAQNPFPVISHAVGASMQEAILAAKKEGDSLGGVIRCAATGLPVGWGNPFFQSIESELASLLFSIPAVKGVSFGDGFALTQMTGQAANDAFAMMDGAIQLKSNHNGGISGGITNGQPLLVNVGIRPTPTISKTQETVDISRMENISVNYGGRHDPCIVPRAVPVIEAATALCLMDFYLGNQDAKMTSSHPF